MSHSTCFLPNFSGSFTKILVLLIVLSGAIMLAEGCVKRPDLQPTPGVAPKGIEFHPIISWKG